MFKTALKTVPLALAAITMTQQAWAKQYVIEVNPAVAKVTDKLEKIRVYGFNG